MKLQFLCLLAGIAAGFAAASCNTSSKAADELDGDYINSVNAHIDRRLADFNEKEEAKLPVFSSPEAKAEFMTLSFLETEKQANVLSLDFSGSGNAVIRLVFDKESRTLTRTIGDKSETFTFEPFTNGIPPVIPYDAHLLYAFATNFNRIAETVTLRSYQALEKGSNPAIPGTNVKTKTEPAEYRIDNRWCHCYDVKLKSVCAPAVSLSLFVSSEEKTVSRIDIKMADDSMVSYAIDWREQDGIVLPRTIKDLKDNSIYFREDAKIIKKSAAPASADKASSAE